MLEQLNDILGAEAIVEGPDGYEARLFPQGASDVQAILKSASEKGVAVVTTGAADLIDSPGTPAILVDPSRMDVIEIRREERTVLCGAGVMNSALASYLEANEPTLYYSLPESAKASVAESALTADCGVLSAAWGTNADMIGGQEVVFPDGRRCLTGAASIDAGWFARSPLPDLAGVTVGWLEAVGIVTRLSVRLFPKPSLSKRFRVYVADTARLPLVAEQLARTEIPLELSIEGRSEGEKTEAFIEAIFGAFSEKELQLKKSVLDAAVRDETEYPKDASLYRSIEGPVGDLFVSPGAVLHLWSKAATIARDAGGVVTFRISYFDVGHGALFRFRFSGGDETAMARRLMVRGIEVGAFPRRPDRLLQQEVMKKMNETTRDLMRSIKKKCDPKGILNPGLWEAAP